MKRIVISDTHIGSLHYNGKALASFLRRENYDQLILAGDIIDFIKIPLFTERAADILEAIDYSKEIIYIVGNHDFSFKPLIGRTVKGISFVDKFEFKEGGRKFRVEHGDQYESGIVHMDFLIKIISIFHDWMERKFGWDLTTWYVNHKLKKRKLRRVWDILSRNNDVDVLIVGHSHIPECIIWVDETGEIKTFCNSGDWVAHTSWVDISDGVVRLRSENS